MPGPVSDSYDPEWGTRANAEKIDFALGYLYDRISEILGESAPMYILDLVEAKLPNEIEVKLSERQWRLIRFALERARDSL